ncbi:MAG: LLM class F420-dependent oxidoreductase [Chloroflexota bacterium]
MRAGVFLPHMGTGMSPLALVASARRAEELGYDNVWVAERLLYPTAPRSQYPATPDGSLPSMYRRSLTPIETLTYVAAHTTRIGLGTSVLIMPLHNPVMLARQLASLDVLSGGRLRVGLGQGWSVDEIEAAGSTTNGRAARADEFVEVLKTVWTTDPAAHAGTHYTLPESTMLPKPAQKPHPPIYMAAYAPDALKRTGRLADGWMPAGVPLAAVWQMMSQVREAAWAAGREAMKLELLILAFPAILPTSPGENRPDFVGTLDEIRRDVEKAREIGATEIIFTPGCSTGDLVIEEYTAGLETLRALV